MMENEAPMEEDIGELNACSLTRTSRPIGVPGGSSNVCWTNRPTHKHHLLYKRVGAAITASSTALIIVNDLSRQRRNRRWPSLIS